MSLAVVHITALSRHRIVTLTRRRTDNISESYYSGRCSNLPLGICWCDRAVSDHTQE